MYGYTKVTFKGSNSDIYIFVCCLSGDSSYGKEFAPFFPLKFFFEGIYLPGKQTGSRKSCFTLYDWYENKTWRYSFIT